MAITVERLIAEIEADPAKALASLKVLNAAIDSTARDRTAKIDVDVDNASLARAEGALNGIGRAGGFAGRRMGPLRLSLMAIAGGGIYAGLTAIPGALSAIAATAGAAVAAVGPLVGLLGALAPLAGAGLLGIGAVVMGLGGVSTAYQAMSATAMGGAAATEAVRAANLRLVHALEAVKEARENLAKAPHEAKEAIEDRRFAMEQALISEKRAVMGLKQAQENLAAAQNRTAKSGMILAKETDYFTGKVFEVARQSADSVNQADEERQARLDLRQAELDLKMARDGSQDAARELAEFEKKGIKNSDIMVDARRRLRDAEFELSQARRDAATAAKGGTAANIALADAMSKLTPVGRRFVTFLHDEFIPAFKTLRDAAQEGLLPGLERGLRSFMKMFPMLRPHIKNFSKTVGDFFADFMGYWAETENQERMSKTLGRLNGVLKNMLGIVTPLSDVMLQLTDAATPLANRILVGLTKKLEGLSAWMESPTGKKGMREFFKDAGFWGGEWMEFLGDVLGILKSISDAAQPLARGLGFGDYFEDLNKRLKSDKTQKAMTKWFNSWKPSLKEAGKFIRETLDVLFTSSKGGKDGAFFKTLRALRKEFLPALENLMKSLDESNVGPAMAEFLGNLTDGLAWLAKNDGIFTIFVNGVNDIADALRDLNKATNGMSSNALGILMLALGAKRLAFGKAGGRGGILGMLGLGALAAGNARPGKPRPKPIIPGSPGKHAATTGPKHAKPGRFGGFRGFGAIPLPALAAMGNDTLPPLLPVVSDTDALTKFLKGTKTLGRDAETTRIKLNRLDEGMVRIAKRDPHRALRLMEDAAKESGLTMDDLKLLLPKVAGKLKWLGANANVAKEGLGNFRKELNDGKTPLDEFDRVMKNGKQHISANALEMEVLKKRHQDAKQHISANATEFNILARKGELAKNKTKELGNSIMNLPKRRNIELLLESREAQRKIEKFGHIWDGLSDKQLNLQIDRTVVKRTLDEHNNGQPPNRSGIDGNWNGGRVGRGEYSWVGERGPELVRFGSAGTVHSASESASLLSSNGSGITDAQLERVLRKVQESAKAPVNIDQTFNEKVDPMQVGRELAWRLA